MNSKKSDEEMAALCILKSTGIAILEAALIAKEALDAVKGKTQRARKCIEAGVAELQRRELTVTFENAVKAALDARKHRRKRTISDFKYYTNRFMKRCEGLRLKKVRTISTQECEEYIAEAFTTTRQQHKARIVLSGVFSTAVKRGWCEQNPAANIATPQIIESPIPILTQEEIRRLLIHAREYEGGKCLAAVGMMLYAGIRPNEVARLHWHNVDLNQKAIFIMPRHSKTGGARKVTIHRPLLRILSDCEGTADSPICPSRWLYHWRELRKAAGWTKEHPWVQDALRHTYASYHLQRFKNYEELQCEIGHRDSHLLRTRYVDMRGVGDTQAFWEE